MEHTQEEVNIMKKAILRTTGVAALAATVLFTGCGSKIKDSATLITINKGDGATDTITLGYGNFVARYQQSLYDQFMLGYYGEDMWSQDVMGGLGYTMEENPLIKDVGQPKPYLPSEHLLTEAVHLRMWI